MNKVCILGRVTSDPELRRTQSGTATCRFTVAVDRKFADKNTGKREADFISCLAFKQSAEFVSKYFSKGKKIAVEGSLRTGSYDDKKHPDVKHYTTDVIVDSVDFCGDKAQQTSPAQAMVSQAQAAGVQTDLSDYEEIIGDTDIPF